MKQKLSKKAKILLTIILTSIVLIATGLTIYFKNIIKFKLHDIGYDKKEISILYENLPKDSLKYLTEHEHLNYIIDLISKDDFKNENLEKYIDYISKIKTDYNIDEVIYIINNDINYSYSEKLVSIIHEKYFIKSRLDRYMNYDSNDYNNTISKINSNRDYDYYLNSKATNISDDYNMIVNKYYYLDKSYVPSDLVDVNSTYAYYGNSCRKEVLDAFIKMYNDAKLENLQLIINSSYRSYESQDELWSYRKDNYGIEYADAYAARPGYSEHQTGLALDLDRYPAKNNEEAYDWLAKNAYKYGFILRYPKEKEDITGYKYEPWHYRYVGTEVAQKIFEEGISLEEYYAFYIEKQTNK